MNLLKSNKSVYSIIAVVSFALAELLLSSFYQLSLLDHMMLVLLTLVAFLSIYQSLLISLGASLVLVSGYGMFLIFSDVDVNLSSYIYLCAPIIVCLFFNISKKTEPIKEEFITRLSDDVVIKKQVEETEVIEVTKDLEAKENIETVENIEAIENIEAVEEIEEIEEIEDVENIEDIEEILVVKDIEEIEDILVVEDIEEIEDILVVEDIEDVEDILVVEDIEDAEDVLVVEDIEDVEDILVVEDIEDVEDILVVEDIEDAEDILIIEEIEQIIEADTTEKNIIDTDELETELNKEILEYKNIGRNLSLMYFKVNSINEISKLYESYENKNFIHVITDLIDETIEMKKKYYNVDKDSFYIILEDTNRESALLIKNNIINHIGVLEIVIEEKIKEDNFDIEININFAEYDDSYKSTKEFINKAKSKLD